MATQPNAVGLHSRNGDVGGRAGVGRTVGCYVIVVVCPPGGFVGGGMGADSQKGPGGADSTRIRGD